jgi:hypothetical protein
MPSPGPYTSHYAFRRLLYNEQLRRLSTEATYLAERPTSTGTAVPLPRWVLCRGSFNVGAGLFTEFHAFISARPLAVYAALIELPAGLLPT